MKIKTDFVTNSSSVSFVGWGICLDESDLIQNEVIMKKCFENYKHDYKDDITFEEFKEMHVSEILDYLPTKRLTSMYFYDEFYIAGNPNQIRDNETLGEYKIEIINELKNLGFDFNGIRYIQESWRDG